jgi:hypothetical protein
MPLRATENNDDDRCKELHFLHDTYHSHVLFL